jgi:hypothetical protein
LAAASLRKKLSAKRKEIARKIQESAAENNKRSIFFHEIDSSSPTQQWQDSSRAIG